MALLTLDNVGPMTLRERAKEARRQFRSAIVPVFGARVQTRRSPRANNLQLVGSGILITIDGDGYLATAAHVIDELDHSPLWIPRENELWPLSGDIFQTEVPSEGRRSDTIDCGWLHLGSTVVAKFGSASFVSENAISFNRTNCSKRFYMAYGFPRSKNKKYTSGQVSLQARSYSGCGAEPDAIPAFLRRSRPRHIFLEYDERTTEGEDGVRRNVSAPAGMSGGALIDMGVFSDPMISNPSTASAPLLSGVLLEFHRKHGLMIALDVQVVIEGIKRSAL